MMQRIFHFIGQGAFYSERHQNFNIVYDCGCFPNKKASDNVIKNAFDKEEKIDVLFISHFDYDHINKINVLKDNFEIKKVVLPLLDNDEKVILKNISDALYSGKKVNKLIQEPKTYFKSSKIILVKKAKEELENNASLLNEINNNIEIESGTRLIINNKNYNWEFIPYNYQSETRSSELIELLKTKKYKCLTIEKLKSNDTDFLYEYRKDIKKLYSDLSGTINQNSMMLYSGRKTNNNNDECNEYLRHCFHNCCKSFHKEIYPDCYYLWHSYHRYPDLFIGRSACLYTGDAEWIGVNEFLTKLKQKNLINNIGTIQIPHHGSLKSFDENVLQGLEKKGTFFPVSFGTNNTYGHPSEELISQIIKSDNTPVFVTEKRDSMFIQDWN